MKKNSVFRNGFCTCLWTKSVEKIQVVRKLRLSVFSHRKFSSCPMFPRNTSAQGTLTTLDVPGEEWGDSESIVPWMVLEESGGVIHSDSKCLKLAGNKFTQSDFTSFDKKVSANLHYFRFRSLTELHIHICQIVAAAFMIGKHPLVYCCLFV